MKNEQYEIAIVDDVAEETKPLCECLDVFSKEYGIKIKKTLFHDSFDFIECFKGEFDIVFMDIKMPGMDGLETAKRLRKIDQEVALIFLTNLAQYAIRGYEVSAVGFLLKPLKYKQLAVQLLQIMAKLRLKKENRFFYVHMPHDVIKRISENDVYYITKENNYIVFYTTEGPLKERGSLKEMEKDIESGSIKKCARACLVNLRYLEKKDHNIVYIKTNEGEVAIPVTKPYQEQFKKDLMNYLHIAI